MDNLSINNYKNKINLLVLYFGISESAAKYMFHRRRRGHPFKKEEDNTFLRWTVQLQNALIEADKQDCIKWGKLKFADELQVLADNKIDVVAQSRSVAFSKPKQFTNANLTRKGRPASVNKIYNKDLDTNDDNDWTVVTNSRNKTDDKQILRRMGFLPIKKNQ